VDHVVEEPRDINLSEYINEILDTLSSQLKKKGINYNSVEHDSIKLQTIPGAFAQVLTNLITNTIGHAFTDSNIGNAQINIELNQSSEDEVTIIFSDNGCGMSSEVLENIYEPFYTTKRSEGGTGLGMNIVYNIVLQKLKGKIDIQSKVNEGTTVTLSLPIFIDSKITS
jgi:signal transduction histidine kinase